MSASLQQITEAIRYHTGRDIAPTRKDTNEYFDKHPAVWQDCMERVDMINRLGLDPSVKMTNLELVHALIDRIGNVWIG